MDFYEIRVRKAKGKDGGYEIYPEFLIDTSDDLMIRGKDFYAVYDESSGMWVRDPKFVRKVIDRDIWEKYKELKSNPKYEEKSFELKLMRDSSTGMWDRFIKYISHLPDDYHQLDEKLCFQDTVVKKKDYISKRLPYSLQDGDISAYEELVSTLYSREEREKFEWAIGSIVAGDSKKIQKFVVFYGPMGSGKSTIMNLIENLFGGYDKMKGYCAKINAKALVGSNVGFALEPFARSPLVGIDQDSKLSKIEDNTILNQIVSHDTIQINEKFKNLYDASAGCFLFMGTNEPVRITDSKSGVIRRLIDVEPTGNLITPESKYDELVERINFELGAIAKHCLDVYRNKGGKSAYAKYIPTRMIVRTDPFYNFMKDNMETFILQGGVSANELWDMYNAWCDKSRIDYRLKRYQMVDEAKNYFENFDDRIRIDGEQVRNWYSGLKTKKFIESEKEKGKEEAPKTTDIPDWLNLKDCGGRSILDLALADCPAQYGDDKPELYWKDCKTKLKDIDTHKTHYVQGPINLIHIDFDKKNKEGKKDLTLNIEAAMLYPKTYAEVSKGGQGLHLSYYYDGDPNDLSRVIEPDIECKVQIGNAALRRRLSKCNNQTIAHISSGLPLRKKKVLNEFALLDSQHLRTRILKALRKEIEPGFTTTCINYIEAQLLEAQEKGIAYDLKDLSNAIFSFAASSSHNSEGCLKKYYGMKLRWPEEEEKVPVAQKIFVPGSGRKDAPLVFCDVEVGKNVLLVCYKEAGPNKKVISMFNPMPKDLEKLFNMRLVGYNCRNYDAHILYARYVGYNNYQCWELSQNMIVHDQRSPFRDAENVFEIDVYDYTTDKKSLKKWEIQLGEPHMEMEVDWSEDIPEELWPKLAEYCCNDVIATEKVFEATQEDFKAREIMCELTGMPLITTTNQLSAKYIFGDVKEPWQDFVYPDLKKKFPEYKFVNGKSYYLDELIGEGGRVWAKPGMYYWVWTFDVASMHPSSIVAENGFGPFTKKFKELMDIRVAIKHKNFDDVKKMNPALGKYLNDVNQAKALSFALKIVINSVYGLTAAKFQNKFKDPRNVDNWVAKRGALFMESLRRKVQAMGANVIHIKTDSIKIVSPTEEVKNFIINYGKEFGYNFEIESIYERICLVNDAVYIAKCSNDPCNGVEAGHWAATGAQFLHRYVFKTLFSKEPIVFDDLCETKSVKTDIYLDMNEKLEDDSPYSKELVKVEKKIKQLFNGTIPTNSEAWWSISKEDMPMAETLVSRYKELKDLMVDCHNYKFIGKVGLFCPVLPGVGGGLLMRKGTDGRYSSVTGTKGYRWLEATQVPVFNHDKYIDMRYFYELASEAIETIEKFGSFTDFATGEVPPWDY